MKALKKILISLLVIAVLLVVVSFFLPGHYSVKRTITVNAPYEQVIAQVNNFENWANWSPWAEKDSTIVNTFEGDINGDSYTMSWTSKESGVGSMTREEMSMEDAASSLKYKLAFTEPFESTSNNSFLFEKTEDGGVQVTWTDEGDMGNNPIAKYMGLFMDGMIGPDFEKGLENLKKYIEDPANQKTDEPAKMMINGFEAELSQGEAFNVIGIRKVLTMAELQDSSTFAENYGKMGAYCGANKITPVGPPAAIYYEYNEKDDKVDVMFAFPVAADVSKPEKDAEVQLTEVPAGQLLTVTYVGPYDQSKATWDAIDVWLQDMGMDYANAPWESYVSDPSNTPVDKLITKIVIPVGPAISEPEAEEDAE